MKKFVFKTLGCKVNQCESELIADNLKEAGMLQVGAGSQADFCIINTCTVTGKASMQSRQAIRKMIRACPDAHIIITGCYAQTEPDEIWKIKGVHEVVGNFEKHRIPELILKRKIYSNKNILVAADSRTRPFLKIQDGCDAFCTYCIVPYARGTSRSMPFNEVIENINHLKKKGCHEVVLTGIHLGRYGKDLLPKTGLPKIGLIDLLKSIDELKLINRVRLSSIEPCELSDDIIRLVADSKTFCRHFHLPLQSGCDNVLKRMHRPYTSSFFKDLILKINKILPDAAIGVDVLIGFPGETDNDFENTYSIIKELPVTYLHVFPFSPRKGTKAFDYPDKVKESVIKDRCKKIRDIGMEKKERFFKKAIGKKAQVLIESKRDTATGFLKGMTSNYIPVLIEGEDLLKNKIIDANIYKKTDRFSMMAKPQF